MKRLRWLVVLFALLGLVAASCGRDDDDAATDDTTEDTAGDNGGNDECEGETPEATEVGVTADTITVEVSADTGSPLAPGLFQGNVDAMNAFAEYVNENGGIACRDLEVKSWDSKLNPDETKNGQIDACRNALAMVGSNSLFNPDTKTLAECPDKAGEATGLPDIAALANDVNQLCNPTTYLIQLVSETCPVTTGQPRELSTVVGPQRFYTEQEKDLHGVFMVPGDLPTTVQSATTLIAAQEETGIKWDAVLKVSGRDEQSAYTPKIQALKAAESTYVYNGSNDRAMINIRKEAKAQGVDTVKIWACSLACYTRNMLTAGGSDVEDTYVWMQFLPFEEADENEQAKAYVDAVGEDKVDSFGAQAWQAGLVFKQVIDEIVEKDGINGITRAAMLETLENLGEVDAGGWMGKKDLRGASPCVVIMQIQGGEFVRVHPEEKGTMDCDEENVVTVTLDPAVEAAKIK